MAIESGRLRSIIGGSAGNLVEWYDFYAYSALTIYFAPLFFPDADPTTQLANAAAISAGGFLMRPVGGWLMGVYGDRYGRKAGLALSVALMCAGSLMIAFAPTAAQAGTAAPWVLLVARLLQGLSVGGEYGASATYLSEMATPERRGFYSSFQYVTLVGGQLAALAVLILLQQTLGKAAIDAWAWRLPFLLGAALALFVYRLRSRLAETPAFEAMARRGERGPSTLGALWRDNRRAFLLIVAITAGGSLAFYAYTTYLQKFLVNSAGYGKVAATNICAAALFLFMLAQPAWGALSDRIGRKAVLLVFGVGGMIVTVPVFHALGRGPAWPAALALMMIPLLIIAAYTAVGAVVKAELFPAHIRTLGVALPYAIGNTLFGGTAEYIALWFKQAGHESGFFWYVTAMCGVALIAFLMLPETRNNGAIAED